ncbi:glycosyltransferase [Candidatus Gracilibacteria bacterium]|nr:MAG: glycosyltransferase [Candidatus Gracilibacteria bacterium]
MKDKINIIQFLPYYPPHKGGLETVAEDIGIYWEKNNLGNCINIITSFEQEEKLEKYEKIEFVGEIIGYKKDKVENLVVPSLEIINNFPIYKIWSKKYKKIAKYLKAKIGKEKENYRIITHTRFFLTSFLGGKFAIKNKVSWVHIEHGSDYVKLSSKFKSKVAYFYDRIIGKWIFKKVDKLSAISEACKNFILKEFKNREIDVFYRGLNIPKKIIINENLKNKYRDKIIVGYIGRLYKWKNIFSLIEAYYLLGKNIQKKIQIVIVGDGEDYEKLKLQDKKKKIYFTGGKNFKEALAYQKQFDIHIHPSSPGGGLATTLLQAMHFGCFVVATPNEGAKEVIKDGINGILLKDDSVLEIKRGLIDSLENINKKEEFGQRNQEIIFEKFVWEKNILELYKFII